MLPFTNPNRTLLRSGSRRAALLCGALSLVITAPTSLAVHVVTMSPVVVNGGASATATVTLDVASATGTSVLLSSSRPSIATVPGKFSIPARARSGTFTVQTSAGNGGCSTISARTSSTSLPQTALISVRPTTGQGPMSLHLSADTALAGTSLTGTVAMSTSAAVVQLSSSNPAVVVPPTAALTTLSDGVASGTFPISTPLVQPPGTCSVITATSGSAQRRALLRVVPIVQG
jgi:hypothetical protein